MLKNYDRLFTFSINYVKLFIVSNVDDRAFY